MSTNYKNFPVHKRTETITVKSSDFPSITNNPDRTRVKKVLDIRKEVRSAYLVDYKDVDVHFVDGVCSDLMKTEDDTTIPDELVFEVTLTMPLVQSNAKCGMKNGSKPTSYVYYKDNPLEQGANDHIYWS